MKEKVLTVILHFVFLGSVIFLMFYLWSGLVEYVQGTWSQSVILKTPILVIPMTFIAAAVTGGIIIWKKLE